MITRTQRHIALILLLLPLAVLQARCGESGKQVLGQSCARDDQCQSSRCDELVCKSEDPAGPDEDCEHDLECGSEQCASTASGLRCAPGVRLEGTSCTDDLQCVTTNCQAGLCVALPVDGAVPDLSADSGAEADAGAGDSSSPDTRHDATGDGGAGDTTVDAVPDVTIDIPTADAGAPMLLFTLRTLQTYPSFFAVSVEKSGLPLRWDLADGNVVDANDVSHLYTLGGTKDVRAFSFDGPAGLTALTVQYSDLTGTIPPEFGQLSNLTSLRMRLNGLSGSIPPELGQLTKLQVLALASNRLGGPIPPELGQLVSLTSLDLDRNEITGALPSALGQLSSLEQLRLNGNRLVGVIPAAFGQLTNLTLLDLGSNNLSGSIPPEIGQLTGLTRIVLYLNDLSGYTPGTFSGMTAIEQIDLSNNFLDQAALDAIIDDLYQARDLHTFAGTKSLDLGGTTNGDPSPEARRQVDTLVASYNWIIVCNRCK